MNEETQLKNDPDDKPVEHRIITKVSTQEIDLNNISGAARRRLVASGDLDEDQFSIPANIPGGKLRALKQEARERARNRASEDEEGEESKEADESEKNVEKNTESSGSVSYKVGDFIEYKGDSYEVYKIDESKGVQIEMYDEESEKTKRVWVKIHAVKKG